MIRARVLLLTLIGEFFAAVHKSAVGSAPRRRESPVEEESTQRVVD